MVVLKAFALILALIVALLVGTAANGSPGQTARARYHHLLLSLNVRTNGSTVYGRAKLTNQGKQSQPYDGGCAPPIVQIQAYDAAGNHIHGWQPPEVNCFAIAVLHLAPGTSLVKRAHFTAHGAISIQAVSPIEPNGQKLETPAITVSLP